MILLIKGISTEPALFHVGCRPSLHVVLLPGLISDPKSKWPTQPLIWSCRNQSYNHIRKARPTCTSDHVGHLPQPSQKGLALTSVNQCRKGSALTLIHVRNQSSMLKGYALTSKNQCQKGSTLIFDNARNQSFMLKWLCTYIWQPMSEGIITYIRPCKEPILHAERALHLHMTTNVKRSCTHI